MSAPGPWTRLLAIALVVLVAGTPLLAVLQAVVAPAPDPFGATPDLTVLAAQAGLGALVLRTLVLGLSVSALSVIAGGWLAWVLDRGDLTGRRAIDLLVLLPVAVPSWLIGAAVARALPSADLGLEASIVVLTVVCAPQARWIIGAALATVPAAELEAARTLGATRSETLRAVVLPRLRPALVYAGVLSLTYAVTDFGAVAALNCPVLTWRLFQAIRSQQLGLAGLLGLLNLALVLPLLGLAWRLRGPEPGSRVSQPRLAERQTIGRAASLITWTLALALGGIGVLWPAMAMTAWVAAGQASGRPFAPLAPAVIGTLQITLPTSLALMLLAMLPAWVSGRSTERAATSLRALLYASGALPAVLLAFGWILAALGLSRWSGGGGQMYGFLLSSGLLLALGYATRFLPELHATLETAFARIEPRQEEAARTLGATTMEVWRVVRWPAVRHAAAAAWLLGALALLKELPVTLLLGGPTGIETLAFRVWDRYSEARWHEAGAAGLMVLVFSVGGLLLARRFDVTPQ